MDLEILSLSEAGYFSPDDKACAIRLGNDQDLYNICRLKDSFNWVSINSYYFDFVTNGHFNRHLNGVSYFDEKKAKKLIIDLEKNLGEVNKIVIQSYTGESIAPAVAIAFNELYDWGKKDLKKSFPKYDKNIYKVIMCAAENLFFEDWYGEICARD